MAADPIIDLAQRLSRELSQENEKLRKERERFEKALDEERRGLKLAWLSVTPLSQLAGSQFLIGKIICCSPFMQAAPPSYDVVPHHFG